MLTNGDLDHVLGLFSLRESTPLTLFATTAVVRGLERNAMLRTLRRFEGQLTVKVVEIGERFDAFGVSATAFALPGKPPKHLEGLEASSLEDNIGLVLESGGRRAVVATAFARAEGIAERARGADVLLADGTFWSSDELVRQGLGSARAEDMAHQPVGGAGGSLDALGAASARRRIYTHVNNTNPMIVEGTEERRAVEAAGLEVAFDGMELLG
jgi:pyrroloquinoline quinone biosynthesis protein B